MEFIFTGEPDVSIHLIQRACEYCFKERMIFTQKKFKQVIDQLLDRPVVPKLFFYTVLRALNIYPRLSEYTLDVLIKMIKKRVCFVSKPTRKLDLFAVS